MLRRQRGFQKVRASAALLAEPNEVGQGASFFEVFSLYLTGG